MKVILLSDFESDKFYFKDILKLHVKTFHFYMWSNNVIDHRLFQKLSCLKNNYLIVSQQNINICVCQASYCFTDVGVSQIHLFDIQLINLEEQDISNKINLAKEELIREHN